MQIDVIDNLRALMELKPKWDELYDKARPGLFSHHSWVYQNYRCFDKQVLLLAVFGDPKKLIGVFPFTIEAFNIKWFKFKALVHGGSSVTDYSQFIIDPDANNRLMIKRILVKLSDIQNGNWSILKIENLSDNDDNANMFKRLMMTSFYAGCISTEITPIIDYAREYQEAKKIANVKRRFKKIKENSEVKHESGLDITESLMTRFSDMHRMSHPGSSFDKDKAQSFYKSIIQDDSINSNILFSYIDHDEKMIAAHFGFMNGDKFYYYVPSYDETYSTYGPGQYLLLDLITMAENKQVKEFDLLRGPERYKFNWANKINTNYTVLGVSDNASFFTKLLVNLWLVAKNLPFYNRR